MQIPAWDIGGGNEGVWLLLHGLKLAKRPSTAETVRASPTCSRLSCDPMRTLVSLHVLSASPLRGSRSSNTSKRHGIAHSKHRAPHRSTVGVVIPDAWFLPIILKNQPKIPTQPPCFTDHNQAQVGPRARRARPARPISQPSNARLYACRLHVMRFTSRRVRDLVA